MSKATAPKDRAFRRWLAEHGWDAQGVSGDADRALAKALAEFRAVRSNRPDFLPAPEPDEEGAFEAGFLAAVHALWGDVMTARERMRTAAKGRRGALVRARAKRAEGNSGDEAVRRAVEDYRAKQPGASARSTAAYVARKVDKSPDAVRHAMRRLRLS